MTLEARDVARSGLSTRRASEVAGLVRAVPDFPEAGVTFQDITPLLADGEALHDVVRSLARSVSGPQVDLVVGMEARGFLLGAPLAIELGVGFVPLRKEGKLPPPVEAVTYDLEYGSARLEVRSATVPAGARVLVIDDVLATGGTAAAAVDLVERCGAEVVDVQFLLEIDALAGREALAGRAVTSLWGVPA
ncbi:adenine phosphoribosyltransferase [Paraoerskovia sediminicola]|uniref:Adenine phosphoribosyltransferase n=1 Tax=Paraoerskovia sediminicola TaxID=1138587 RepID=A0ABN6XEZ3_9CELL|nr:adenine phosphoribosyltransferase [Paraoerskovia sediminicola]BDZ43483.1 adenine phosphoribosyltransferase [Paraoerskovia sediminicola]